MIAAWMLWSIGVGLLLLVAGLAAERVLEGRRRWVWAVAGVATVVLMTARVLTGGWRGHGNSRRRPRHPGGDRQRGRQSRLGPRGRTAAPSTLTSAPSTHVPAD